MISTRKALVALGLLRADTERTDTSLPVGALARAVGKITHEATSQAELLDLLAPWLRAGIVRWGAPGRLVAA